MDASVARRTRRLLGRVARSEAVTRVYLWAFKKRATRHKERYELDFQEKEWCSLFSQLETRKKVEEYWIQYRHLEDIRRLVPMNRESVILDVGCGLSTVLHYLPGHRYGVDPLGERYKAIYRYPEGIDIRRGYGEAIPHANDFFDVVFSSNCIDHTASPSRVIREVRRVLKPDGHFIVTCEAFAADVGRLDAGHPHSMTRSKLEKLVKDFAAVQQWDSPWIGLRNYAMGLQGTGEREYIFLLKNS